jgi:iron complex outermembrane receptor protein
MTTRRDIWLAGAALVTVGFLVAGAAVAAPAQSTAGPTAGGEGAEGNTVVVVAERSPGAAAAPTKASLEETQPESIISHRFIEQVTPETGGWTTVATIAPSISGITSNNSVGDYNVITMRGFSDGEFNLTYDGIAFGDTNNPTHHGQDYFPASTIGSVVVDRGPGAAGDLGQANFGGAVHFFSPEVSDTLSLVQKLTYGLFNTRQAVTTLQTGDLPQLGGGKLWLNFDELASDGELTESGGDAYNQAGKFVLPVGSKLVITTYVQHQWDRFNFEDSEGPGETWPQVLAYGKDFSMTAVPGDEHNYSYNYERKQTSFDYLDFKYQADASLSLEDQPYIYGYSNQTKSTNDLTGLVGGPNTSPPTAAGSNPNDIGGFDKLNAYTVYGDIARLNQQWSFGELRIGALGEGSSTERHNCFENFTLGFKPDDKFKPPKFPFTTNCKLLEHSDWQQWQVFADFDWYVTDKLRVSPGIKYVDFKRDVDATDENVGGGSKNQPLVATNTYASPLYFLTANYKLMPYWSVYGQIATSFLIPELSGLYVTGANLQSLQSEYTTNYQAGTVYAKGDFTADADVYLIDATNLQVPCTLAGTTAGDDATCNEGKARFSGVEGEAAYTFPSLGLTLFANGALNTAKQLANAADPARGITANPAEELANSPAWTDALGAILHHGPWSASLTYKQSGAFVDYNTVGVRQFTFHLPGYDTVDGSLGYDFGRFQLKLQGFNLLDRRAITSFTPAGDTTHLFQTSDSGALDTSIYTLQAGRMLELTLIAKVF